MYIGTPSEERNDYQEDLEGLLTMQVVIASDWYLPSCNTSMILISLRPIYKTTLILHFFLYSACISMITSYVLLYPVILFTIICSPSVNTWALITLCHIICHAIIRSEGIVLPMNRKSCWSLRLKL